MPKKRVELPVIPAQNRRICGTICICQMTAILSSVAIVYLTVAVYFPSMRAFYSGVMEQPVMCSTSKVVTVDRCNWGSCGEWCLSKTSGSCVQIYVNLRRNGSSLNFENCINSFNKTCYGIDEDNVRRYRCKQEECKNLTGTFNCTTGSCINITDVFECQFRNTEQPLNCSGNRGKINCMDISGLNTCAQGVCSRINEPYNCDRRCVNIPTRNKNVILISGDRVFLSQCQTVSVDLRRQGDQPLDEVENQLTSPSLTTATPAHHTLATYTNYGVWNDSQKTIFLASCFTVSPLPDRLQATDCVNGTVIGKHVLADQSNFTFLYGRTILNDTRTLQEQMIAPLEVDLLIANDSRLMINLEGCVNTLKEECKQFLKEYGKDGADYNARARFPCYYANMDPTMVVARFSLEITYREFLPAAVIPAVLLAVSCSMLILCQRTVVVGDDAKMRFKKRGAAAVRVGAVVSSNGNHACKDLVCMADTIKDKGGGGSPDNPSVDL